jgi:hypothetical protein
VRSGELAAVSITRRGIHRQWSAATLAHKQTPEYVAAFVDLLARIGGKTGVAWRPALVGAEQPKRPRRRSPAKESVA